MRTFAIGDIHGGYRALKQCLERASFNKDEDRLICLGDVADGWSEVVQCIEELRTIKNLVYIRGNHDEWLRTWLKFGESPSLWTRQGGQASIDNYLRLPDEDRIRIMDEHTDFFDRGVYYFVDEANRLYVHGGYNWRRPIEDTSSYDMTWDRHLWETVSYWSTLKDKTDLLIKDYKEVFIGHTSTSWYDKTLNPVNFANVWNLDQGGGFEGKLTLLCVDTKEYFQSDIVKTLYPEEKGR